MKQPSKAAREKALKLSNAEDAKIGNELWPEFREDDGDMMALARYIDEVSEKVKGALDYLHQRGPNRIERVIPALQSLILPDEPCKHVLGPTISIGMSIGEPSLFCYKCGKRLKLVEANGDD